MCDSNHLCPTGTYCKADTQQCVECLGNYHCNTLAQEMCGTDNTCAECNNTGTHSCNLGYICNESASPNSCVRCINDSDCLGEQTCDQATFTCKGCIEDCSSLLPYPKICNQVSEQCESCVPKCTGNQVCNARNNTCAQCVVNRDCVNFGGDWTCDCSNKVAGVCVDGGSCTQVSCDANWFDSVDFSGNPIVQGSQCSQAYPFCLSLSGGGKFCGECNIDADCVNKPIGAPDGLLRNCVNNYCQLSEQVFEAVEF